MTFLSMVHLEVPVVPDASTARRWATQELADPVYHRGKSLLSRLLVVVATLMALFVTTSAPAGAADDYPWRTDTTQSSDRWGFTKRQCVSFVAWRMAQRGTRLDNRTQGWSHARNWDDAARRLRYAWLREVAAARGANWVATGHTANVEAVYADGSVRLAQYNMYGNRSYSLMRAKAPRYLYVGIGAAR